MSNHMISTRSFEDLRADPRYFVGQVAFKVNGLVLTIGQRCRSRLCMRAMRREKGVVPREVVVIGP